MEEKEEVKRAFAIIDNDTKSVLWIALTRERATTWINELLEKGVTYNGEYFIDEVVVIN